jgi:hypothetical protein
MIRTLLIHPTASAPRRTATDINTSGQTNQPFPSPAATLFPHTSGREHFSTPLLIPRYASSVRSVSRLLFRFVLVCVPHGLVLWSVIL